MSDEGEIEQAQEAPHPGWQRLTAALGTSNSFFEKFLFLKGYGNLASNIYLITEGYVTIVDPGNDYTALTDLFKLNVKPADIKKIVLTHTHQDHAMGAFELLRAYPSVIHSGGFELILHETAPRELKEGVMQFGCRVTEVRGGETLDLSGVEWEVIHTPGHTIDGICLYHALTKTAFTGDTVLPDAMAAPDPHWGGRMDHYLFGVKALLRRDIANVLPGHGLPVAEHGRRVIEDTYEGLMMKIIGVEPQTTPWMDGAMALAQRGLLEEAVFCCEKELARRPESLKAVELRASCLNDLGRSEEAIEVFDSILARTSDNVFALTGKGCALMGLGRYDESLTCFDAALRISPGAREAQVYKGMALYLSGKPEEAMEIEAFSKELTERVKQQLQKRARPSGQSDVS